MTVWNIFYMGKVVDTLVAPDNYQVEDIKRMLSDKGILGENYIVIKGAVKNAQGATFNQMCDILIESINRCENEIYQMLSITRKKFKK